MYVNGVLPPKEGKEEKRVKEFILFSYFLKYTNMHTSEAYWFKLIKDIRLLTKDQAG
jgi:hypothetical protein